jgi:hypothetical protein
MIHRMQTTQRASFENEEIAFHRLNKVLLAARWIVFRTFFEVARDQDGGKLPDQARLVAIPGSS